MKYNSITDIIGPVMVGPSSSHTAGAVRIGQMANSVYGGIPEEATIIFYGSFAHTYKGHGTDVAIVAGLLGLSTFDDRIPEAFELAEKHNMKVIIIPSEEQSDHPNTARMHLKGALGEVDVVGISIGGGTVEIVEINDFKIVVHDDTPTSIVLHQDKAGVIASVTEIFGKHNINIGHMQVSRKEKGERALMTLETDDEISDEILEKINSLPNIYHVIQIQR